MMKKIFTVAVIALVLAACSNGSTENSRTPGDPDYSFGETLNLSGQVYTRDIDLGDIDIASLSEDELDFFAVYMALINPNFISYNVIDAALSISDSGLGGSGEIKNGNLSYIIEKPNDTALTLLDVGDLAEIGAIYTDVKIQPPNVNAAFLSLITIDNLDYSVITREKISLNGTSFSFTVDAVSYVYVDQDVTITAQGDTYINNDLIGFPVSVTTENVNLNLEKGWNALHSILTVTPDIQKLLLSGLDGLELTGNFSISASDPSSLYWVLTPIDDELLSFN